MQQYGVYFIGPDNHFVDRVDLICVDEDDARQRAKNLAVGDIIELWIRPDDRAVRTHAIAA